MKQHITKDQWDEIKQHFKTISEEVNVKVVRFEVAETEKGILSIVYTAEDDGLKLMIENETINDPKLLERLLAKCDYTKKLDHNLT